MKKFITLILLAFVTHVSYGQTVNYKISYNTTSCKYEAYLFANSAFSGLLIPGQAQFTIAVPASMGNSAVSSIVSSNPANTGWSNTNFSSTTSTDYYSMGFTAGGSFSAMSAGDSLLLFSFSLDNDVCASNVRPFVNGTDPQYPGGSSSDFRNSFIVTFADRYSGNETSNADVAAPTISSLTPNCTSTSKGIDLSVSAQGLAASCGSLSYAWTGPNGFSANTQNITVADHVNSIGAYAVTVSDDFGCESSGNLTLDSSNCFAAPVPVTLLSFDGFRVNDVNKLYWSTATEINNKHFVLERKIGDGEFEEIATIESQAPGGNSNSILDYAYNDHEVKESGVVVLYMLKQVDYDEAFEYHGPVRIDTDQSVDIAVFPNPANNVVNIVGLNSEFNYTVRVHDLVGKELINQPISATDATIDVSLFSMGVYNVIVTNENGIEASTKVIIGH